MADVLLAASLIALLALVTITDLRARLIPDRALIAAVTIAAPLCVLADPAALPERLLSAIGAGGFLLAAVLIRSDGMGLGDVKLVAVLGLYLGVAVIEALLVALLTGSIAGAALLVRHGLPARTRTIPFAPFLTVGVLVALAS
jgi:prepilin signal peptidase PulO-like enzyme (type II secretory pathway)